MILSRIYANASRTGIKRYLEGRDLMICTLHNGLGPLDNKVNVTTSFISNMLEKNARKIKMLEHVPPPTFVLCLALTLKIKITLRHKV
jgi:hypothetical protein